MNSKKKAAPSVSSTESGGEERVVTDQVLASSISKDTEERKHEREKRSKA